MNADDLIKEALENKFKSLDLSFLQLEEVPKAITQLTWLEELILEKNRLTEISIISNLTSLKSLNLFRNKIQDISPIASLENLQRLDLANNEVEDLTPLTNLLHLEFLDVSYNEVKSLYPLKNRILENVSVKWKSGNYYTSRGIYLIANPFIDPPIEIIQKGNFSTLNFFQDLEKGDEAVHEAKLLIIGEAGAGKTTLARKLRNLKAEMPEEIRDTTTGIDVQTHIFPAKSGKTIFKMSIWDFGGQAIYHTTHQFFLSKRSLYVMVLDGRKDEKPQKYWLRIQELLGGNSPLLILTNIKGTIRAEIPMTELKQDFPNVKKHFRVNLKDDKEGIKSLLKVIENEIRSLPHLIKGEKLPKSWNNIRTNLEQQSKLKSYISEDHFRKICVDSNVLDEKKQDFIGEYLHDLGVILYFRDHSLLGKMVILNTEWATDAVYTVLDHTKLAKTNGTFNRRILKKLWTPGKYAGVYDQLLALMEKFELCYRLPTNPSKYIIPELLPLEPQKASWDDQGCIRLIFIYSFLPKGVLTRLIVRLHHLISRNEREGNGKGTVWKRGVILFKDETRALIEQNLEDRIEIKVNGLFPRDLLGVIVNELEIINSTFKFREHKKINVTKLIPCNCSDCETDSDPHFFSQNVLFHAKEKEVRSIQCHKSFQNVELSNLLEDGFVKASPKEIKSYEEIKEFLDKDKFEESFKLLKELIDKKDDDLLAQLQGRWISYRKNVISGVLTEEEKAFTRLSLMNDLLRFIKYIENS